MMQSAGFWVSISRKADCYDNAPMESFFHTLKEFKRIAMRADKIDQSYASMIHLAAVVTNSR
jgi:transposase InsO family protein